MMDITELDLNDAFLNHAERLSSNVASVSYAMECAERDAWIEAGTNFWASTGADRAYWRRTWRAMIQRERERLRRQRHALAQRAAQKREGNNDVHE